MVLIYPTILVDSLTKYLILILFIYLGLPPPPPQNNSDHSHRQQQQQQQQQQQTYLNQVNVHKHHTPQHTVPVQSTYLSSPPISRNGLSSSTTANIYHFSQQVKHSFEKDFLSNSFF